MNRYRVFGLTIASDLNLPELFPADPAATPDISIVFGPVPPLPFGRTVSVGRGRVSLECEGAGRYQITDGRAITIDPQPEATEAALRLYLLGSALGAIVHQRGLLPLHANAVVVGGRAVAIAGAPSAGKSTLAAWFYDHGDTLLSDDVCALEERDGEFVAHAGVPRLRLHPDALEASGRRVADHAETFDGWGKYVVSTRNSRSADAAPFSHAYLLRDGEEFAIDCLAGAAAVQALSENTYRGFYVRESGMAERHFRQCTDLAREAPLFVIRRPRGLERLDRDALQLRDHALSVLAS